MVQITMVICTTTKGNLYIPPEQLIQVPKILCTPPKIIFTIHPNSTQKVEDDKKLPKLAKL